MACGIIGEDCDVRTDNISSASSRTNIFMPSVLRKRRWIMSWTRPGVPTTTWGPS